MAGAATLACAVAALLAHTAASLEALANVADDDATSLLQQGAKGYRSGKDIPNACQCLGWKDAYTLYGAKCGLGHEVDFFGVPRSLAALPESLSYEFCDMYFSSLPNISYCMNAAFSQSPQQWCYVAPGCTQGEALQANSPVKVKTCWRGKDAALGDMKFESFAALIHESKLELGLATKFAYPTWGPEKFPEVMAFWGLQPPPDVAPIGPGLRGRLQRQMDSGKPMFFNSRTGHPPFGLMEGRKLYFLNFNPANPGFAQKEDMVHFACVAGCGDQNQPLW